MQISSSAIISKINSDFAKNYKPFTSFPNSGVIWSECIGVVQDPKLMNFIIQCNDVMEIPPVKVFLKVLLKKNFNHELTIYEKKAIGAFWGFVFKFVFGYKAQKDNVPVNVKDVKKAAYFYSVDESIEVVK